MVTISYILLIIILVFVAVVLSKLWIGFVDLLFKPLEFIANLIDSLFFNQKNSSTDSDV